jgi:ABC-type glycerol-3-phosphate transport system substrate-binding protein
MVVMSKDSSGHTTRRRKVLATVGSAGVVGVAGCTFGGGGGNGGGNGGGEGDIHELDASKDWPDHSGETARFILQNEDEVISEIMENVKTDFEAATGATLNYEFGGPGDDVRQRVVQLIQAGDPPTVAVMPSVGREQFLLQGRGQPITDVAERVMERLGKPFGSARKVSKRDGEWYSLPYRTTVAQYYYREDIDAVDGLVPETWDDLLEYCRRASESDTTQYATVIPAASNYATQAHFRDFGYSNGARFCYRNSNDEVQVGIHTEYRSQWIETIEYLDQLHEYAPRGADAGWGDIINGIQSGVSAANWYWGSRPKFQVIQNERPWADATRAMLTPEKETSLGLLAVGGNLMTFPESNTELAETFLEFFMQWDYALAYLRRQPTYPSPYPEITQRDDFSTELKSNLGDAWSDEDYQVAFVDAPKNSLAGALETEPTNPYFGTLQTTWAMADVVRDVLIKDEDPAAALDTHGARLEERLTELKSEE